MVYKLHTTDMKGPLESHTVPGLQPRTRNKHKRHEQSCKTQFYVMNIKRNFGSNKLSCPEYAKVWFFSSFYNFDYSDYNNYNDYGDSDLDLDWERFSELDLVTLDYYWQIAKLESWHWGILIYNQWVTWTAFAILAMFYKKNHARERPSALKTFSNSA